MIKRNPAMVRGQTINERCKVHRRSPQTHIDKIGVVDGILHRVFRVQDVVRIICDREGREDVASVDLVMAVQDVNRIEVVVLEEWSDSKELNR